MNASQTAAAALAAGQNHHGHNHHVTSEPGRDILTLHDSQIVTVEGDRVHVTLAGYPTPTTRRYINAALNTLRIPARYEQRNGKQIILKADGSRNTVRKNQIVTFKRVQK